MHPEITALEALSGVHDPELLFQQIPPGEILQTAHRARSTARAERVVCEPVKLIASAAKVVIWLQLSIPREKIDNCLDNLAMEKHIQSRIPRIWELIGSVNSKYTEPAVQKAAREFNMTATEAKALIACPVQYLTLLQKCVLFFCCEAI